jgi:hypothetical protein
MTLETTTAEPITQFSPPRSYVDRRSYIELSNVKSEAYGRREETAGIFQAVAAAADAYASAT